MELFLDTASIKEIAKWAELGIIDGVTTNPTHLSKEGGNPSEIIKKICELVPNGFISVEVTEETPEAVYDQARRIAALSENILVKVPCHIRYYATIAKLVREGVALNITLVFSSLQAMMMAKLGVDYVSPFVGRLQDSGGDGIGLLSEIKTMFDNYIFDTKILAASLRSVDAVKEALLIGVDAVTVPVEVCEQLTAHQLTDKGMQKFLDDWKKLGITQFP